MEIQDKIKNITVKSNLLIQSNKENKVSVILLSLEIKDLIANCKILTLEDVNILHNIFE
jgi:hypothetical protein